MHGTAHHKHSTEQHSIAQHSTAQRSPAQHSRAGVQSNSTDLQCAHDMQLSSLDLSGTSSHGQMHGRNYP